MIPELFSVRMHAEDQGRHLSGAERLVGKQRIEAVVTEMLRRASGHDPSAVRIRVERVAVDRVVLGGLPDMSEIAVDDVASGRETAREALVAAGVTTGAADAAIRSIAGGAAPDGGNMRGAMLVDATTGERLEPTRDRGVRVSRMDIEVELEADFVTRLAAAGYTHHRTREALILAAKVFAAPGIIAELCWSDDPAYTTGYVAAPGSGYLRIPHLKETGDALGGRVFFCASAFDPVETIRFLEETPFLVNRLGRIDH